MKIKSIFILLNIAFLYLGAGSPVWAFDGGEIVNKTWHNYRLIPNEFETISILQTENGVEKTKKILRWSQYNNNGEDKITIKFTYPARDKGLALLTCRHPDSSDDQWLRMPSWKKVRRVSIANESKYFAGTDLTYEDVRQLASERIQDFHYQVMGENTEFWKIKAIPKADISSGYGYRVFWINKAFVLIKIEYYSQNGRLLKVQTNNNIQTYENGGWRANMVEIDNVSLNRKTKVIIEERDLAVDIDQSVFCTAFLSRN